MNIATIRFDGSEFLQSSEDRAEYLSEALATGDPKVVVNAIERIAKAVGVSELAEKTGLGRSTIYTAFGKDGSGNPSISTLLQMLNALDLKLAAKAA